MFIVALFFPIVVLGYYVWWKVRRQRRADCLLNHPLPNTVQPEANLTRHSHSGSHTSDDASSPHGVRKVQRTSSLALTRFDRISPVPAFVKMPRGIKREKFVNFDTNVEVVPEEWPHTDAETFQIHDKERCVKFGSVKICEKEEVEMGVVKVPESRRYYIERGGVVSEVSWSLYYYLQELERQKQENLREREKERKQARLKPFGKLYNFSPIPKWVKKPGNKEW